MKKLFPVLFISFAIVNIVAGQPGQLIVKSGSKGLYLDHTVVAKEGLFSIGRIYNVHPRFIASYNNIDFNKGLNIGQVLHIPLTDTNFSQKNKNKLPVYYRAGEKENLQKVSKVNNKVSLKNLRDWNKFYKDSVAAGTKLIVGYLVANESAVAAVLKTEKKEESAKEITGKPPVVNTDKGKENPVVKNEPKKEEPKQIKEDKPVTKTEQTTNKPAVKTEPVVNKPVVKDEPKKEQSKKTELVVMRQDVTTNMTGQGYFKSFFDQQVKAAPVSKTETVTSGIFKMAGGMRDTKYYLLMDAVPPGTIVRVINPENNKAIYAKVLGEMNNTPSSQGLNIRISNTAASTLGVSDTEKFIVTINY